MPPNDSSGYANPGSRGYLRGYNSMQLQMGIAPQGYAPQPLPTLPSPPPPSAASSQLLQQQMAVSQMTMPAAPMQFGMTPMGRPAHVQPGQFLNPSFSNPMFGTRRAMARQSAVMETNQYLGGMQAGAGVMGRMGLGAGAAVAGGMMMGPLGAMAAPALLEYSGMGQAAQMGINSAFQPLIQQRARGLQFQNMSQNFVRSGINLSSSGQGLSMGAAQQTVNRIRNMAQDEDFQSATRNMFNTQDVMKISRLAGNLGMLNQSSTTDQITRDIKKISVSLSNFMKLAGEPDVQEAMRQMGQMRHMGMSFPEISVATSNARQFARMAGVDTRTMMQQGMAGAQLFQGMGLSGATGMQAAMGAQGFAGLAQGAFTPRQLAMAGGQQGIASTLMQASGRTATMDVLLPALLTRRNGQLGIDREAVRNMLTGDANIQDMIQQGAGNIRRLGGRDAIQELSTRRRELQDEMMSSMSPQMQALLPMVMASRTARSVPGMSMGGALRTMGFGEQQARTMELMAQRPEFQRAIIQQQQATQLEAREERMRLREETRERARTPEFVRRMQRQMRVGRRVGGFMDTLTEELGMEQDIGEDIEARGGTVQRVFQRDRFRTELGGARRRDLARRDPTRFLTGDFRRDIEGRQSAEDSMQTAAAMMRHPAFGMTGNVLSRFMGPEGFGVTQAGRGGEFMADTTRRHEDIVTRGLMEAGLIQQDPREVRERARELDQLGRMASQANSANARTRIETSARARESIQRRMGPNAEVDPRRQRQATAVAATAVQQYLDSRSVLGVQVGGAPRSAEMQSEIRQALMDQGFSAEEANQYVNTDFMQDAMNRARPGMTPDQRSVLDNMIQGGSESRAQLEGQSVAALRAGRVRRTEAFMQRIGAGRGVLGLGGISESDQRAMLDVLGGGDDQSRMSAALLLQQSDDEVTRQRGIAMQQELEERLGPEQSQRLIDRSQTQVETMDEDVRRTLATGLGRAGSIDRVLEEAAGLQEFRARSEGAEGLTSLLGGNTGVTSRVQEALRQGDTGRARRIIRSFAESDRTMGRSQRDRLMRIVNESGDEGFTQALAGAAEQEITGGSGRVRGGAGLDTALDLARSGDIMMALQEVGRFATGGGGEGQSAQEGVQTPRSFEEAVVMFSEAARDLKEAAEQFNGDRSIGSLVSTATSASPVAGLFSGLFGGE